MAEKKLRIWETAEYKRDLVLSGGKIENAMNTLIAKFNEMEAEHKKMADINETINMLVERVTRERDAAMHLLQRVTQIIQDPIEPESAKYSSIKKLLINLGEKNDTPPAAA